MLSSIKGWSCIIIIIFMICVKVHLTRKCIHRSNPLQVHNIGIKINHKIYTAVLKASKRSNLRIHFEYSTDFSAYENSDQLKREVFIPAQKQLQNLLFVKNPLKAPIRVNRACINNNGVYNSKGEFGCLMGCQSQTTCATVEIPAKILNKCRVLSKDGVLHYTGEEGPGISGTDIVLIVDVKVCDKGVLAYATSCFLEVELDRPIVGIVVICNGVIKAGEQIMTNRAVIQHEIIHALGFSSDLFAFYRYQDGKPIVPRSKFNMPDLGFDPILKLYIWNEKIAKKITRNRSSIHGHYTKTVYAITLPTVLEVAKKHFNCSKLDGVDLESYPILSHFSEYVLYNELMTPYTNYALDRISKFTLALLRDTGWYDIDLGLDLYDYSHGKDSGCAIILEGCHKYINDRKAKGLSILPFCDKVFSAGKIFKCSKNRNYFYYCYFVKQKLLPKYQYFNQVDGVPQWDAQNYGGYTEETEYCPTIVVLHKPNSICMDETNNQKDNPSNIINSYYGKDSMCFQNGIVPSSPLSYYGASCQKYYFDKPNMKLIVYFKTKTVNCPSNEIYRIPGRRGYTATFTCPDLTSFEYSRSTTLVLDRLNNLIYLSVTIWKFNHLLLNRI